MTRSRHPAALAFLTFLIASLLAGNTSTRAQGIYDNVYRSRTLDGEYASFNEHLLHVQTVKSIPFFQMAPGQRASAVRGYVNSIRSGDMRSGASSLRNDFGNGALIHDVAIAMTTQILTQMSQGKSFGDSVHETYSYVKTPEYLIGNLMGGTLGAAAAAMIPVPLVGGILGQFLVQVPTMAGAMLGSQTGANLIHQVRQGTIDPLQILRQIDWMNLLFQSMGATAGMMIGQATGIRFLGPVVGGVLGGQLGMTVSKWMKDKFGIGSTDQDYVQNTSYPGSGLTVGGGVRPPDGEPGGLEPVLNLENTTDLTWIGSRRDEVYKLYLDALLAGDDLHARLYFAEYKNLDQKLNQSRAASLND